MKLPSQIKKEEERKQQQKQEEDKLKLLEAQKQMEMKYEENEALDLDKDNEEEQPETQDVNYYKVVTSVFDEKNKKQGNKIQKAFFVDAAVNEMLNTIKTGEDAISFFAKYGNSTPIKFINCVRDTSMPEHIFRPYDLKVIRTSEHQKEVTLNEYYTISAHGIVHCFTEKHKKLSKNLFFFKFMQFLTKIQ